MNGFQRRTRGGRVVNVHALLATGVNAKGHREILGLQVSSAEDGAGWLSFFRDLASRGLTGVRLVISDSHRGLVAAVGATLPGAGWQRLATLATAGNGWQRAGNGLATGWQRCTH